MEEQLGADKLAALEALSSLDPQQRADAVYSLSAGCPRSIVPSLIRLLADKDHAVRGATKWVLYEIGIKTESEHAAIRDLLAHREADVILCVFNSICWLDKDEQFVKYIAPIIINLLAHPVRAVRTEAAKFLIWAGDRLIWKWFESKGCGIALANSMANSSDEARRAEGVMVRADYGVQGRNQDVTGPSRTVRLATAIALARLGKKPSGEERIEKEDSLGKTIASLVLGESRRGARPMLPNAWQADDNALSGLLILLNDLEPDVREIAAVGLQQLSDCRSVNALAKSLSDSDASVRGHCLLALGAIKSLPDETIHTVGRLLHDPIPQVRYDASVSLWKLGSNATPALQDVLETLGDQDIQVRQLLVEVIAAIKPNSVDVVHRLLEALEDANGPLCMLVIMALINVLPSILLTETPEVIEDRLLALPHEVQIIRSEVNKLLVEYQSENEKRKRLP